MNINRLIITGIFFLSIVCGKIAAQSPIGTWKSYLAYQNPTLVAETSKLVFAVYDGSLLSYNPEDEEVRLYSRGEGLNDVSIKHMTYCPEAHALVLIYENSNIDIFLGEDEVYNLPFIKDDLFLLDKTVNNLEVIDEYAYLSTVFGIVVINVQRKEIKDIYRIGYNVNSVAKKGDYLYALTTEGVLKASISSNLLDRNNWEMVHINYPGPFYRAKKILFFRDLMMIGEDYILRYLLEDGSGEMQTLLYEEIKSIELFGDRLVLVQPDMIRFYSDLSNYESISLTVADISPSSKQNVFWVVVAGEGIARIAANFSDGSYSTEVSPLKVNSPNKNWNFYMTFQNDKLYVLGGAREAVRKDNEGTVMILDGNKWTNLDASTVGEAAGIKFSDAMSIAIDPADPNHYFVSTWGEGVFEFQDDQFVKLYTLGNSSLESSNPALDAKLNFVRVDGLVYDKNNTLWMTNAGVQHAVHSMDASGKWTAHNYPSIAFSQTNRVLITSRNQLWVNIWRHNLRGIFAASGNRSYYSSGFKDKTGRNVSAVNYTCMAEDHNGTIWVGTDVGPITFSASDTLNLQNGICNRLILEDEYNRGYYLLENQYVTAIAVDGGNRKWIGTKGGGVYVVDQSDPQNIKVDNFLVENCNLLSNTINSIAINDRTGEVFIGTDAGLCSYQSEVTQGKPDYSEIYAYPNPVYPDRNNQVVVTGLMQDSNIKITDLAGNLVQEGVSLGGQYVWNCTDRFGTMVKAGIYLVLAATPSGSEGGVTKIMVIR